MDVEDLKKQLDQLKGFANSLSTLTYSAFKESMNEANKLEGEEAEKMKEIIREGMASIPNKGNTHNTAQFAETISSLTNRFNKIQSEIINSNKKS